MSRSTMPPDASDGFDPVPSDLAERDRWVCWTELERLAASDYPIADAAEALLEIAEGTDE